MIEDFDACYRALDSKDSRFDGFFVVAVSSTGIYCRPSCPAMTPKRQNVTFLSTAAAAQAAGYRACKRCLPDATPGSPEWNVREDLVARAMRLIADGVVDREGVGGLAKRLHFSERHIHRALLAEVGAGPQALARAHRAQTARILIETTQVPMSEVAFAAGFASIRQFNDTIRQVFASTPTELRRRRRGARPPAGTGAIHLRLPYRSPFRGEDLLEFLGARAVEGVESHDGSVYARTLDLPRSEGVAELGLNEGYVDCTLKLVDLRDLSAAVQRCRRLLDLDADPVAIDAVLREDPRLRPLVRRASGRRVPGATDGAELAVRAVLGQQVSVKGARTLAGRLVAAYGKPLTEQVGTLTHLFPTPDILADADLSDIGLPGSRRDTIKRLTATIASGEISLDPGADRRDLEENLLAIPGIGPWTVSYISMRALRDPDAFLPSDLGVKRALKRLGVRDVQSASERWRPWRAYALQHLWHA